MKEYRMGKNTKECYFSFEEMRKAWGFDPISKKTKNEKKLKQQQENFIKKHKCKACGEPMTFINSSNAMACTNEKCRGIKVVKKDKEGNEIVIYEPSFDILDDTGAVIAQNIFN
jgi:hypothetical protein